MGFSDQIFWYLTRSSAIIAWFAATLSVLVGLLTTTRFMGRKPTVPYLVDIHRFLSGMATVFVGVHMFTLWADDFVDFGMAELFVPGAAKIQGYDTLGLAVGVIAAWIMLAVQVTSLLKPWMPPNLWHALHLNSFFVVILGSWHGVVAGTDIDNRLMMGLACSLLAAVVALSIQRVRKALLANRDSGATSGGTPQANTKTKVPPPVARLR